MFLLRLRFGRGVEEREVPFSQYLEVKAPPDMVEAKLGCFFVRCLLLTKWITPFWEGAEG